jgi:hypothetical protein
VSANDWTAASGAPPAPVAQLDDTLRIVGRVRDSVDARPLGGVVVHAERTGRTVATAETDSGGRFELRVREPGDYLLMARRIGYREARRAVTVTRTGVAAPVDVWLSPVAAVLQPVTVTAGAAAAVDLHTGDQSYQERNAHTALTATPSQLLQQAVAGAARAPTGEVHIRGQHAEYTHYVDGVPVPSGIGGSLNELFVPAIVDRIDFETGGWDAEYGNKNVAVVKVATRIPGGGLHYEVSGYDGSFASNGQSILASTSGGSIGALLSVARQRTDMRREPVMDNPQTLAAINVHNAGQDDFGFGKLEYRPSSRDDVTLNVNLSATRFEVPFDSTRGVTADDHERDANSFLNLGWRRRLGRTTRDSDTHELFLALYLRHGALTYEPGITDQPAFVFYPDTLHRYSVREQRSATTSGVKADYTLPVRRHLAVKGGFDASLVTGREDFDTRDSSGQAGPTTHTPLHSGDAGAYVQAVWTPTSAWQLRTGVRLDHHFAPLAGDQHQVSPRIRLSYFPGRATSLWVYYGRLFIPANVEDFHVLASAAQGGTVGLPTVPERDSYFEVGTVHRFSGVLLKLAGYMRRNRPGVDDNTLPGTAVTATVNIAQVRVNGVEAVVTIAPHGPLSGYVNAALNHAQGHGPITGGFFPTPYPSGWFDQDHDQRLSAVGNVTYAVAHGFASVTGIFGSGLTNGHPEAAPNESGLFDFNPGLKVAPSFILNASTGVARTVGHSTLRAEVFADNLLNRHYILKGAFTSGPSVGRPRSVQLRLALER